MTKYILLSNINNYLVRCLIALRMSVKIYILLLEWFKLMVYSWDFTWKYNFHCLWRKWMHLIFIKYNNNAISFNCIYNCLYKMCPLKTKVLRVISLQQIPFYTFHYIVRHLMIIQYSLFLPVFYAKENDTWQTNIRFIIIIILLFYDDNKSSIESRSL